MGDYGTAAGILAMGALFSLIFLIILVVFYVFKSLAIYAMAVKKGIENPWLAWIPIADLYLLGLLVGEMDLFGYHLDNLGLWVPAAVIGSMILGRIPVIGFLFSLALLVFWVMFFYKLFQIYAPDQAVVFTVLSVFLFPIMLFIVRNNDPVIIPGAEPPAEPPAEI